MLLLQINELSSRGKTILSESKENKEIIINQKFFDYYGIETVINFSSENTDKKKDKGITYIDLNIKTLNEKKKLTRLDLQLY